MTTKQRTAAETETTEDPVDHEARNRELEAELKKLRARLDAQEAEAAQADKPKPPKETHLVVLADGTSFRTAAPVMTHHHVDGVGLVPVVNVFELTGEEE